MGLFEKALEGLTSIPGAIDFVFGYGAMHEIIIMAVEIGVLIGLLALYLFWPKLKKKKDNRIIQTLDDALNTYEE